VNAICFFNETTHVVVSGTDEELCKISSTKALQKNDPQSVGIFMGNRSFKQMGFNTSLQQDKLIGSHT